MIGVGERDETLLLLLCRENEGERLERGDDTAEDDGERLLDEDDVLREAGDAERGSS